MQLLVIIAFFIFPSQAIGNDEYVDTVGQRLKMIDELKKNWPERLDEYLKTVPPATIKGRVIDQFNEPVPDASVKLQWEYFDPNEFYTIRIGTEFVTTNNDGLFSFTVNHAFDLTMFGVTRKGYELKQDLSPYYQAGSGQQSLQVNSINEPIIIKMRKLNPTTFLLKSDVAHSFQEPSSLLRYTMIPGLLRKMDPDPGKLTKPEQNDLIFTVNKTDNGSYTVHIQPIPQIGGSMQVLDDYLYEAPADGYLPEVTLTIRPEDGEVKKYLYFISRKTPVYSRMTMDMQIVDNELRFRGDSWTNPYGKRNLEWEPELPSKLETKLFEEAEKALNNGACPPEPENLQALIEQYSTQ